MQLSLHADYSLRVLIYLAAARPAGRVVSTLEISDAYGISRNHLVRVMQTLAASGYVTATAGRTGGVTLACAPDDIRISDVIRASEPSLRLVECFDKSSNTCPIARACELKKMLRQALDAFLSVLDGYTIADVANPRARPELIRILRTA